MRNGGSCHWTELGRLERRREADTWLQTAAYLTHSHVIDLQTLLDSLEAILCATTSSSISKHGSVARRFDSSPSKKYE